MRNSILTLLLFGLLAASANPAAFYGGLAAARLRGNAVGPELWTPADLTGLALWLDASDANTLWADTNATTSATNNGLVARWDDKSGNARNALVGALSPTWQTNRISLAPADMNIPTAAYPSSGLGYTLITVMQSSTTQNSGTFSGLINIATGASYDPETRLGVGDSVRVYYNSGYAIDMSASATTLGMLSLETAAGVTVTLHRNGTQVASATRSGGLSGINLFRIGRYTGQTDLNYRHGNIQEIIVFPNSLSDRQKLEGYLAHKWGFAGNLPADHPWKNQAPTK